MLYSSSMIIFKEVNKYLKDEHTEIMKVLGELIFYEDTLKENIFT